MGTTNAQTPVPQFTSPAHGEVTRRPAAPELFIKNLDDDFLGCRTEGHRWPKLKRAGKMPRGVRPVRLRDGSFQLTYTCLDCGTEKVRLTLPGGHYDGSTHNSYRYPPGYQSPKGSGLSKPDFIDELYSRVLPFIPVETQQS